MKTSVARFEVEGATTRCVSGLAVFQEHLCQGRWVSGMRSVAGRPCYQGGGDPMGEGWISHLVGQYAIESFALEMDGQSLHGHWKMAGAAGRSGDSAGGTVTLEHGHVPVRVAVQSVLDGQGFVERWLDITNLSDEPMALSAVEPLRGLLWRLNDRQEHQPRDHWTLATLPCVPWGYEGTMDWRPLPPGITALGSYFGRSGWGVPWFLAKNNINGEIVVGHLEWSANWAMAFEAVEMPGQNESLLLFGIGPKARAPMRVVEPGQTIASPRVHLGHFTGGVDEAVKATHRHVRRLARSLRSDEPPVGGARVVDGDMEWLEKEVRLSAEAGMEYFLVDAGWYGHWAENWYRSTGDWQPTRLGNTLRAARELIHRHGMKFGLWMEPESMGDASDLRKNNPGWALQRDGRPGDREGRVLDLSRPEVAEFAEKSVMDMLDGHQADFWKIDYNTSCQEHGENFRHGLRESAAWRYVESLYRIFDRVAERHPGVFLENCAGGGGRLDLGLFRRCHVSCLSDYSVLPRGIKMLNNMTMALPPERLRVYYRHYPTYHMFGGLDTQLNLLMFCNPLFVGFGRDESWKHPDESRLVGRYVDLYKKTIRPVLAGCDVYHHTPGLRHANTEPWCAMEHAAPDGHAGYAGIFKFLDGSETYRIRFRGVRKSATYKLTWWGADESATVTGMALASGLDVTLDGALSSELLLYKETDR